MMIQSQENSFARERALLLLRQVGSITTQVAVAAAPHDSFPPRVFVLDNKDASAAALLERFPPELWLAGLTSEEGVSVFALEFTQAYLLLAAFDPKLNRVAQGFPRDESPCLVVTEGGFAFLPLSLARRSAPSPTPAVH